MLREILGKKNTFVFKENLNPPLYNLHSTTMMMHRFVSLNCNSFDSIFLRGFKMKLCQALSDQRTFVIFNSASKCKQFFEMSKKYAVMTSARLLLD